MTSKMEDSFNENPSNWFKNTGFFFYLVLLGLVYIYFSNKISNSYRQTTKLRNEIKELKAEYVTLKSKLSEGYTSSKIQEKLGPEFQENHNQEYIIKLDD